MKNDNLFMLLVITGAGLGLYYWNKKVKEQTEKIK